MEDVNQKSKTKSGIEWLIFLAILIILIAFLVGNRPELTPLKILFN